LGVVRSVVVLLVVVASAALASPLPAERNADAKTRILYSGDWTGRSQIFAVDPAGRAPLGQVTFGRTTGDCGPIACGFFAPTPSPDGRWLLYRGLEQAKYPEVVQPASRLWLAHADGSAPRLVARAAGQAAWTRDSTRFAYTAEDGLHVVQLRGLRNRRVSATASMCGVAWSPDGRSLASIDTTRGLVVVRGARARSLPVARGASGCRLAWSPDGQWIAVAGSENRIAGAPNPPDAAVVSLDGTKSRVIVGASGPAWSPNGRLLAYRGGDGIHVWNPATGEDRLIDRDVGFDLAWSPDGRSLAYVQGWMYLLYPAAESTGDIRTVTLSGQVHVVVAAARPYGGQITSLAWAGASTSVRYRAPVVPDGAFAGGPVAFIAGDDGRAALVACRHVFVWKVAQSTMTRVDPDEGAVDHPGSVDCLDQNSRAQIYGVGLAGDRVAWGEKAAGLGFAWKLRMTALERPPRTVDLATGYGALGTTENMPVGSGSLLAFNDFPGRVTTTVYRAEPSGCPCPALRTDPGPLYLDDVDAGRILAHGSNAIVVLDSTGAQLLSVASPVPPTYHPLLTAGLAGDDLVVLLDGELRDYDATIGSLRHDWPLPGVSYRGLQDTARGLAAYVDPGGVALVRLSDGATATVAPGSSAAFTDAGLVYADGARVHLVPFDQLPLR